MRPINVVEQHQRQIFRHDKDTEIAPLSPSPTHVPHPCNIKSRENKYRKCWFSICQRLTSAALCPSERYGGSVMPSAFIRLPLLSAIHRRAEDTQKLGSQSGVSLVMSGADDRRVCKEDIDHKQAFENKERNSSNCFKFTLVFISFVLTSLSAQKYELFLKSGTNFRYILSFHSSHTFLSLSSPPPHFW